MNSREMKYLFSCLLRIKYTNVLLEKCGFSFLFIFLSAKLYYETEHTIYVYPYHTKHLLWIEIQLVVVKKIPQRHKFLLQKVLWVNVILCLLH